MLTGNSIPIVSTFFLPNRMWHTCTYEAFEARRQLRASAKSANIELKMWLPITKRGTKKIIFAFFMSGFLWLPCWLSNTVALRALRVDPSKSAVVLESELRRSTL